MNEDDIRTVGPDDFDGDLPKRIDREEMEHLPVAGSPEWKQIQNESAKLKMVEHTFLTTPDMLPQMTFIGAHEAHLLATMMTFDEMTLPGYKVGSAFRVWTHHFLSLRRSVHGKHVKEAYKMSEAGMLTEEDKPSGTAMELGD